ncbi:uncharacterized protein [Nicotiana tomentosiformis]|uniref:uncharacterized protein n=1 Tax=Nicotiana tomentosiformis TaxID=4098 RepID=UPI00388CB1F6
MSKETGSGISFQEAANVARRVEMVLTQGVCSTDASVLFDPVSTYSYVSSYFASYLVVPHDSLSAHVFARSSLFERSRDQQDDDLHLLVLRDTVRHSCAKQVTVGDDEVLRMHGRISVPNMDGLRELILEVAHSSRYSIHPGAGKINQDLRQHYWWKRMKKDIVAYVARCLNCQ